MSKELEAWKEIRDEAKPFVTEEVLNVIDIAITRYVEIKQIMSGWDKKEYVSSNFDLLINYPISFSEQNGKYYIVNQDRKEISLELMVALIKEVKGKNKWIKKYYLSH